MSHRQSLEELAATRAVLAQMGLDEKDRRASRREESRQENAARIQAEVTELSPEAEQALLQVIQPWWKELSVSSLGKSLQTLLRFPEQRFLRASDPIPFFWQRDQNDEGRIYHAQLGLYGEPKGLQTTIRREIPEAIGMAAGYLNNSLSLPVDFLNPSGRLQELHPRVLIDLAHQIEAGTIERRIADFLVR